MAQVRTYTCDICRKVIGKARVLIVVRVGSLPSMPYGRGLDLCVPCGHKLDDWLTGQGAFTDPAAIRDIDESDDIPTFNGVG